MEIADFSDFSSLEGFWSASLNTAISTIVENLDQPDVTNQVSASPGGPSFPTDQSPRAIYDINASVHHHNSNQGNSPHKQRYAFPEAQFGNHPGAMLRQPMINDLHNQNYFAYSAPIRQHQPPNERQTPLVPQQINQNRQACDQRLSGRQEETTYSRKVLFTEATPRSHVITEAYGRSNTPWYPQQIQQSNAQATQPMLHRHQQSTIPHGHPHDFYYDGPALQASSRPTPPAPSPRQHRAVMPFQVSPTHPSYSVYTQSPSNISGMIAPPPQFRDVSPVPIGVSTQLEPLDLTARPPISSLTSSSSALTPQRTSRCRQRHPTEREYSVFDYINHNVPSRPSAPRPESGLHPMAAFTQSISRGASTPYPFPQPTTCPIGSRQHSQHSTETQKQTLCTADENVTHAATREASRSQIEKHGNRGCIESDVSPSSSSSSILQLQERAMEILKANHHSHPDISLALAPVSDCSYNSETLVATSSTNGVDTVTPTCTSGRTKEVQSNTQKASAQTDSTSCNSQDDTLLYISVGEDIQPEHTSNPNCNVNEDNVCVKSQAAELKGKHETCDKSSHSNDHREQSSVGHGIQSSIECSVSASLLNQDRIVVGGNPTNESSLQDTMSNSSNTTQPMSSCLSYPSTPELTFKKTSPHSGAGLVTGPSREKHKAHQSSTPRAKSQMATTSHFPKQQMKETSLRTAILTKATSDKTERSDSVFNLGFSHVEDEPTHMADISSSSDGDVYSVNPDTRQLISTTNNAQDNTQELQKPCQKKRQKKKSIVNIIKRQLFCGGSHNTSTATLADPSILPQKPAPTKPTRKPKLLCGLDAGSSVAFKTLDSTPPSTPENKAPIITACELPPEYSTKVPRPRQSSQPRYAIIAPKSSATSSSVQPLVLVNIAGPTRAMGTSTSTLGSVQSPAKTTTCQMTTTSHTASGNGHRNHGDHLTKNVMSLPKPSSSSNKAQVEARHDVHTPKTKKTNKQESTSEDDSIFKTPTDTKTFIRERQKKLSAKKKKSSNSNKGVSTQDPTPGPSQPSHDQADSRVNLTLMARTVGKISRAMLCAFMEDTNATMFLVDGNQSNKSVLQYLCALCNIDVTEDSSNSPNFTLQKNSQSRAPTDQDIAEMVNCVYNYESWPAQDKQSAL